VQPRIHAKANECTALARLVAESPCDLDRALRRLARVELLRVYLIFSLSQQRLEAS